MVLEEGASSKRKVIKIAEQKPSLKNLSLSALVVDDDPIIRKIHSVILKSQGFKVAVAENGKEAVDLFRVGGNFHIVFIDSDMSIMNGIKATKELRAMGVTCKIVGVTSRDFESDKQAFMEAGLDFHCAKPLTVAKILPLMENLKKN